jgi:MFS family permease
MREEIAEGLRFVVGHPLLRRVVACTGLGNLFGTITTTLLVLFALRELGLSASVLGLVFSAGSVGGILGAVTAARFARLVGEGRAIPLSAVVWAVFAGFTPLAALGAPEVLLGVGTFGASWAVVVYNVTQVSFRQRLCPPALLGRMNASVRFIVYGTMPLGGLLGGVLGTAIGIVPTLWVAVAGTVLAALPVVLSPLARMRDLPDELDARTGPPVAQQVDG